MGGVRINYARAGTGRPVVLLHGGSLRWQSLEPLMQALATRHQVYALDLRGHGRSQHVPSHYRLADYATDVTSFLEGRTGPAAVFGHSLGAQVAIMAASRRPDLFRALAIGDVELSRSRAREAIASIRPRLRGFRELAGSRGSAQEIAAALRTMWIEDFEGSTGRAADVLGTDSPWFAAMAESLADLDPTMLDAVIEFEAMYEGYEAQLLLPSIACPVLLIQADPARGGSLHDDEVATGKALLREVRNVRIEGAGHSAYVGRIGPVLSDFFRLA